MDKMTSGEIAKKAGISQKAVRIYDEKGLLKPVDYSESNYRLYDEQSLLILEKIIALKHIGFSLEQIREHLEHAENDNVLETLQSQIEMMERKRYELEKAVKCMKAVIARSNGQPDWDDVAEIIQKMEVDQSSDEGHFHALKHNADGLDWYVKLYHSLKIKEGETVLDLGCGFGKLWRHSWKQIPENVSIDGYDLRGSWADDLEKFIDENRGTLADGTGAVLHWGDVEQEATWKEIEENKPYSMVVAHYLLNTLKDVEGFVSRVSRVLKSGGMFSVNNLGMTGEQAFWRRVFDEAGLDESFVRELNTDKQKHHDEFQELLNQYFDRVVYITIPSPMAYDTAEEVFERAVGHNQHVEKYLTEKKDLLLKYFDDMIKKNGKIIVESEGGFWHCYKA